jgi:renalase
MKKIAIIGSGLSAMTLAYYLKDKAELTIFEKARGVGGRMATRRAEPFFFDHGAQFFSIKTAEFKKFISSYIEKGVVKEWHARFVEFDNIDIVSKRLWNSNNPHYVAVPGMSELIKSLSVDLDLNIKINTKINKIISYKTKWNLEDDNNEIYQEFDWVISTAPAEQTVSLMPNICNFLDKITLIKMQACFSLMLGMSSELSLDFDAALIRNADISWVSVNNTKPGRNNRYCLLVNSTNKWAEKHIDQDKKYILDYLIAETAKIIKFDPNLIEHQDVHAWRYANASKRYGEEYFLDENTRLASCGDWCIQGRVESAFTSAFRLSDALLKYL